MIIAAFGERPQEMGGFRTHNPVRLWVRSEFKRCLQQYPDARVLCSLDLGVGQWCAEVATELGRDPDFVGFFQCGEPNDWPSSWHMGQKTHAEAIVRAGKGVAVALATK